MSYSEPEATLVLCSNHRSALMDHVESIRRELDTRGTEYNGPITYPRVPASKIRQFLRHLNEPDAESTAEATELPDWLFPAVSSEDNLARLVVMAEEGETAFGRQFTVYGEDAIRSVLELDHSDQVVIAAQLGSREHIKGGRNAPYTYDPNVDHISEI